MNPGDTISRYRIVDCIGKGGMGVVYRAEDTRLERRVALKFLPHEGFTDLGKSRFLNEARAAAKARHPNICPIHDIEEAGGELFLVMAYIEGETLHRRVARGPLAIPQVIQLATQIASGLACAHSLGIVHRDIKSGNIIVDGNGQASILDFGLALLPDALRLTYEGASVGTPAYMSPEQIQGGNVDARSDLWSLGIVMFEMLTATLPFRRDQPSAVIHSILHDPAPALTSLRPGVPLQLQRVIEKALAKDPARRWQSAAELVAELKRIGGSEAIQSPEAMVTQTIALPRTTLVPFWRSRTVAIVAAAFFLIALGGGFGVYHFRGAHATASPAPAAPATKLVGFIPFETIGPGDATRTIADGLAEVLAAALSEKRFQGAVTAVAPSELRSRHITGAEEARRVFGLNFAITGSARQLGDKVEFTVTLVDAPSLRQIAQRTFIYDPKNPMVSRDQAVTQVAGMMNLDGPAAVRSAAASGGTVAPSAYSAYLEGRGALARYDLPGNVDRAIASFTAAAKQDPKYALAYSGLGEAFWRKANSTGEKQWATLANQNAEYAVRLDGDLAIAHTVLGYVYLDAGRQQDAISELQRAMALAPANAEAPRKLAEIYKKLGRFEEAEALYLQSTKSRPTDWYGYLLLGVFYYERERYPEAEAQLNQAKALTPDNDLVRQDLAGIYRMHGRYQDAIDEYQQALRIRTSADNYVGLGGAYFYLHRFQEAVTAVDAAIDLDSTEYRYWGNLGVYCHWAPGNAPRSAVALRRAIELAEKRLETTKSDDALHANLAEYRARLGDAKGALAEIEKIPVPARGPLTTRLAIVYELTGHRALAIQLIRSNFKNAASLNQIKDHPDLEAVWREARLQ